MAIDSAAWHLEDAGTVEKASRHIALFLSWAAGHGLASSPSKPSAKALAKRGGELRKEDLTDEGNRFARRLYDPYLAEVSDYAAARGVDDYDVPEDEATRVYFQGWLDAQLLSFRARKPAKKSPKAAPKTTSTKKAPAKKSPGKAAPKTTATKKAPAKKSPGKAAPKTTATKKAT